MNKIMNSIHEISQWIFFSSKQKKENLYPFIKEKEKYYCITVPSSLVSDPKELKINAQGNQITLFWNDQRFPFQTEKEVNESGIELEVGNGKVIFYISKKEKEPIRLLNDLALNYL